MIRYVFVLLILIGLGYWAYSSRQEHVKTEKQQTEIEARREVLKNAVTKMAAKSNAVTSWGSDLAGGKGERTSLVFSAELQKVWVVGRPILFMGSIKDIALNKDGSYQIAIEDDGNDNPALFLLQNKLRINLRCPESITVPLIEAEKSEQSLNHGANIAIIGLIDSIESSSENIPDGDPITVLTGVGKCINALYLTE